MVTESNNREMASNGDAITAQPSSSRSRSKSIARNSVASAAPPTQEDEGSSTALVNPPPTTTPHTNQFQRNRRYLRTPKIKPFRQEPSPIELSPRPGDSSPLVLPDDPDERQELFHKMFNVPSIAKNPKVISLFNTGLETYGPKAAEDESDLSDDGLGLLDGPSYTRDAFKKHRNDPKTFRRDLFPHDLPPQSTDKIEVTTSTRKFQPIQHVDLPQAERKRRAAASGSRQSMNTFKHSIFIEIPLSASETPERHVITDPIVAAEIKEVLNRNKQNSLLPSEEQMPPTLTETDTLQNADSSMREHRKISQDLKGKGVFRGPNASRRYDYSGPPSNGVEDEAVRSESEVDQVEPQIRTPEPETQVQPSPSWFQSITSTLKIPFKFMAGGGKSPSKPATTNDGTAANPYDYNQPATPTPAGNRPRGFAQTERKNRPRSSRTASHQPQTERRKRHSNIPKPPIHLRGVLTQEQIAQRHREQDMEAERQKAERQKQRAHTEEEAEAESSVDVFGQEGAAQPGDKRSRDGFSSIEGAIVRDGVVLYPRRPGLFVAPGYHIDSDSDSDNDEDEDDATKNSPLSSRLPTTSRESSNSIEKDSQARGVSEQKRLKKDETRYNPHSPPSYEDENVNNPFSNILLSSDARLNTNLAGQSGPFKQPDWIQKNIDAGRDPLAPPKAGGNIFNRQGGNSVEQSRPSNRFEAPDPNAPDSDDDEDEAAEQGPIVSGGVLEQKQWNQTPPPKAPRPGNAQLPQLSNPDPAKPVPLTAIEKEKMRLMNAPREPSRLRNMTTQISSPLTQDNQAVQIQVESHEENEENEPPFQKFEFSAEIKADVANLENEIEGLIASHLPPGFQSVFTQKTEREQVADVIYDAWASDGFEVAKMQKDIEDGLLFGSE